MSAAHSRDIQLPNALLRMIMANFQSADLFRCRAVSRSVCKPLACPLRRFSTDATRVDGIAFSLRFQSIEIPCARDSRDQQNEFPPKTKLSHQALAAIDSEVYRAGFVRRLSFDMGYSIFMQRLYQCAKSTGASARIIKPILREAWAGIELFDNVDDFSLALLEPSDPDFIIALLDNARSMPFWSRLSRLHLGETIYRSRHFSSSTISLMHQLVALANNVRILCLTYVPHVAAGQIPSRSQLPNLCDLDLTVDYPTELALQGIDGSAYAWLSTFRDQLSSLSIRNPGNTGIDVATIHTKAPRLLESLIIFPKLLFLRLHPVFALDLLTYRLSYCTASLEHLELHHPGQCEPLSDQGKLAQLSSLRSLSLACRYDMLQTVWHTFTQISPKLTHLNLVQAEYDDYRYFAIGIGRADPAFENQIYASPTLRNVTEMNITYAGYFSRTLWTIISDAFPQTLHLHINFTGSLLADDEFWCVHCQALAPLIPEKPDAIVQRNRKNVCYLVTATAERWSSYFAVTLQTSDQHW